MRFNIVVFHPDTAIVNGDIQEPNETSITPKDAKERGVCIDNGAIPDDSKLWQIIDDDIECPVPSLVQCKNHGSNHMATMINKLQPNSTNQHRQP